VTEAIILEGDKSDNQISETAKEAVTLKPGKSQKNLDVSNYES
jgi:hypothetical protein